VHDFGDGAVTGDGLERDGGVDSLDRVEELRANPSAWSTECRWADFIPISVRFINYQHASQKIPAALASSKWILTTVGRSRFHNGYGLPSDLLGGRLHTPVKTSF
jgi:hypothetical protein